MARIINLSKTVENTKCDAVGYYEIMVWNIYKINTPTKFL